MTSPRILLRVFSPSTVLAALTAGVKTPSAASLPIETPHAAGRALRSAGATPVGAKAEAAPTRAKKQTERRTILRTKRLRQQQKCSSCLDVSEGAGDARTGYYNARYCIIPFLDCREKSRAHWTVAVRVCEGARTGTALQVDGVVDSGQERNLKKKVS